MRLTPNAVDLAQSAVNLGCAVVAWRASRRQGGNAAWWPAAAFGVLSLGFLATAALPVQSERALFAWAWKAVVATLVLAPYCLYRFTASSSRLATAMTAGVVFATAWVPAIPVAGSASPWWWPWYAGAVAVQWTTLSVAAAVRMWRAGRGRPYVARRRMQVMAAGVVVMDIAVVLSAILGGGVQPVAHAVGLAGSLLLAAGYAPPPFLRTVWRRPDTARVRNAEVALLRAETAEDVAAVILPHVTRILGGVGSVLVDAAGAVVHADGLDAEQAAALAATPAAAGVLERSLHSGRLVVQVSPWAPAPGGEEAGYLERLAMLTELALGRAELLTDERESRARAERAHADMETFVYAVSHDLKSPLMSLAGFLDLLRADLGDAAVGEIGFYLDRMKAGTAYMQALLHDLLELSRIGRVETATEDVDLSALAREVAGDLAATAPAAVIEVNDLPVLSFNPVRARQLVTNLVANAVAHGGRADIRVRVTVERTRRGVVRLVVADDGVGIPRADRERVFGVFERLSPAGDGSGVGLAVCRRIVEWAGGSIKVGPSAVGTRMEVELPADLVRTRSLAEARR